MITRKIKFMKTAFRLKLYQSFLVITKKVSFRQLCNMQSMQLESLSIETNCKYQLFNMFTCSVIVISSDPPCKDQILLFLLVEHFYCNPEKQFPLYWWDKDVKNTKWKFVIAIFRWRVTWNFATSPSRSL